MTRPQADRPHMPGYGISEDAEGLLPWSWARDRLENSRNYWIASLHPEGRPHLMPVWAVWLEPLLYFSTAKTSRKARNLYGNKNISVSTERADETVIVEGIAAVEEDHAVLRPVWDAYKAKYDWGLEGEPMFVVRPKVVFAFIELAEKFATAATRWRFD
jgi:general stress protein 26